MRGAQANVAEVRVGAFKVPTEQPESDGTLEWDATTLVLVEISAAGAWGLGYTYSDAAAARIVAERLAPVLRDTDAFATRAAWRAMRSAVRNLGQSGLCATAI